MSYPDGRVSRAVRRCSTAKDRVARVGVVKGSAACGAGRRLLLDGLASVCIYCIPVVANAQMFINNANDATCYAIRDGYSPAATTLTNSQCNTLGLHQVNISSGQLFVGGAGAGGPYAPISWTGAFTHPVGTSNVPTAYGLTVESNGAFITGDAYVSGRLYLDGTKASNLAKGDVSPGSTDAVTGSQLYQIKSEGTDYFQANSALPAAAAVGLNSVAVGPDAISTGSGAMALGTGATASANASIAFGDRASAAVAGGLAIGAGSITDRPAGSYIDPFTGNAFATSMGAVSVGSIASPRQITNVAPGTASTDAVNVGQLQNAISDIDRKIPAPGTSPGVVPSSTALPAMISIMPQAWISAKTAGIQATTATGAGALAVGPGAAASGGRSTALGANSSAPAANSVAIGANSVASEADTVSVGAAGNTRRITNVGPATASTDAINLSQFRQGIGNLQRQMSDNLTQAYAGTAAAIAVAGLHYDHRPGKISASAATGYYHGQAGVAIGVGGTTASGLWRVNGGATLTPTLGSPEIGLVLGVSRTLN